MSLASGKTRSLTKSSSKQRSPKTRSVYNIEPSPISRVDFVAPSAVRLRTHDCCRQVAHDDGAASNDSQTSCPHPDDGPCLPCLVFQGLDPRPLSLRVSLESYYLTEGMEGGPAAGGATQQAKCVEWHDDWGRSQRSLFSAHLFPRRALGGLICPGRFGQQQQVLCAQLSTPTASRRHIVVVLQYV